MWKSKVIYIFFRNPGVPTVEEVLEKLLYTQGYISPCNYGILQKICWTRASRTDKKVSAAMNIVSCKLHKYEDKSNEYIIENLNKDLPDDIKIINILEVSSSFNAKDCSNNREYHYIMPSFCFQPKNLENEEKIMNFKLNSELKEKLSKFCSAFKGTKKYHNYTRKLTFNDGSSQRVIYEVSINEVYDVNGIEYIKFKLIGQSFLYNQIRKMIGMLVLCMRENKSIEFFNDSFKEDKFLTPKAPAEGLYLFKIDYSRYNNRKNQKKSNIELTESDENKILEFGKFLQRKVNECEENDSVFTNWIKKVDSKDIDIFGK